MKTEYTYYYVPRDNNWTEHICRVKRTRVDVYILDKTYCTGRPIKNPHKWISGNYTIPPTAKKITKKELFLKML